MATTANRKKLFFNLRAAKSKISVFDNGDIRHDQVETIAKRLGVTEQDVIDMNGWLSGDASLNAPIRADGDSGEWLDWLESPSARIGALSEASPLSHPFMSITSCSVTPSRLAMVSTWSWRISPLSKTEILLFAARRLKTSFFRFSVVAMFPPDHTPRLYSPI